MIPMTLAEIAVATDGVLTNAADPNTVVSGSVEFDSREVSAGGLFVALSGENVDGHDFLDTALANGAVAGLVSRPVAVPAVVVADVLLALGKLARAVLDRRPEIVVIGVTGSSGKTSTKDLMAQLVRRLGETVAPPGSFNNELGHPYTVLRVTDQTRYLIVEKSSRGPGHITWLTTIAPPRIGVELNVGAAHLGEFGSMEVTARSKSELVAALPTAKDGGVAVLNADDTLVAAMAERTNASLRWFGYDDSADFRASDVVLDGLGRPEFTLHTPQGSAPVRMRLSGAHHVSNALAVAAVVAELGMDYTKIAAALSEATAVSPGRMQLRERSDGVTVIDDAYNANPDSVRAALMALASMTATRRWAVLGHMAELGEFSEREHHAIGERVAALEIDRLVVIGDAAAAIHQGAIAHHWNGESVQVSDAAAAAQLLNDELTEGDLVLVKGSKAAHLEQVISGLGPFSSASSEVSADDRPVMDKGALA